jgi:hypothetical protein
MFASPDGRATTLTFERLSTALLLLVVALTACVMPAQTDTWWQLRAGEVMWSSHRVMLRDEFSHTVAGGYWPNHEWLSQVLFYAAYKIGGLPMLTALCAGVVTICWAVVARLTPASRAARLLLLGAGAVMTSPAWSLRPQVFSLALVAITLWIVVDGRRLWTLSPVFIVWANLHGGVSLGVVLLGAAVLSTLIARPAQFRRMAIVALAALLCTAATPLGFSLWAEVPLSLARLHDYGVMEWQRPGMALIDLPFWISAAAVLVTLFLRRAEVRTAPTVAFLSVATLMFLALALGTRRNIPPFALCAVPLLGTLLERRRAVPPQSAPERPRVNAAVLATAVVLGATGVGMAWSEALPRLGWNPVGDDLRRALTDCPGRLYNRYDDGGYVIWFAKDKKVFIDSRQDPFPRELVRRHIEVERSGEFRSLFARYDIGCALTTHDSPLAIALVREGWTARSGEGWSVFARPAARLVADHARLRLESE